MPKEAIDVSGKRFGRLTVICRTRNGKSNGANWLRICDCGNEIECTYSRLSSGNTKSCGCYRSEYVANKNYRHGYSKDRLYFIWAAMKQRCYYKNDKFYSDYGGRGITICNDWIDYLGFREWALKSGYDENASFGKCTIERIDVNGNYEPDNCTWVTLKEQANNKRKNVYISYKGETRTAKQWSEILGINYTTLLHRFRKGVELNVVH